MAAAVVPAPRRGTMVWATAPGASLAESLVVAFDACSVSGAAFSRGFGRRRLRAVARESILEGALVPAPLETNLRRPDDVRAATARVARELGTSGQQACLLLPDGIARTVLLEPPRGVEARDYARFRLGPRLPYPDSEASIDVLPVGGGRFLAAAVRRSVAEEYEAVAAEAGFEQCRLDLAPLAAVAGHLRRGGGRGSEVEVILGDVALSLAVYRDGELRGFRCRRRDAGADEARRVAEDVERTALFAGDGDAPALRIIGTGAASLAAELGRAGRSAEVGPAASPQGLPAEAAELSWLTGVLG